MSKMQYFQQHPRAMYTYEDTQREVQREQRQREPQTDDAREYERQELIRRERYLEEYLEKLREANSKNENQVELLRRQLSRTERLDKKLKTIQELEGELTKAKARILELEKQLSVARAELALGATAGNESKEGKKLSEVLQNKQEEIKLYIEEIEAVTLSLEDLQNSNFDLIKQLNEQGKVEGKLQESILNAQKEKDISMEELALQKKKMDSDREIHVRKEKHLRDMEIRYKHLEARNAQLERSVTGKVAEISNLKNTISQRDTRIAEGEAKVEELHKQIAVQEANHADKKRRLDATVTSPSGSLNGSNSSQLEKQVKALDIQVKYYQKMVLCHICNDRHKSTMIKRCLHMFCYDCIKASVDGRNRGCPTCGERFQSSDLQQIFF